jgi:hypothetical protein
MEGAHHPQAFVAALGEQRASRVERGVGRGPARGRGIPDVAGSRLDQLLDERLEQLHDVDLATPQRGGVVGHRPVGDAIEPGRIEPGAAHVLLQA